VGFYLTRTVSFWKGKCELPLVVEESESERCGKMRRETSRPVSTKSLPQCVCSILSISKTGPPTHSFVVVCSYLAQPYPNTLRTIVVVGILYISGVGTPTDKPTTNPRLETLV
jgi:hypothetical protein